MDENLWSGDLGSTPFPHVLFRLWENRRSGALKISLEESDKTIFFANGDLALAVASVSDISFQRRLLAGRALTAMQAEDGAGYARKNGIPFARALIERDILPIRRVWNLLADFWAEDIFPLFDRTQGDYVFDPEARLPEEKIFASLPTLPFILQAIRRMKNHRLIEAWLPAETEAVQVLAPAQADFLQLDPHEKHILRLMIQSACLGDLYTLSLAGKKETQKVVYALIHLGLAGPPQPRNKMKSPGEMSSAGLEKTWNDFNDKCAYIYKYISKEIGPVALSVLEKALDEVRMRLAPPLQGLHLRPDGRVELKPFPLLSLSFFNEESRKNFLHLLNEVLAAEVLSVKKTLGNAHEAAVVKNLEKIGEPG
jgi:hypothetical protein